MNVLLLNPTRTGQDTFVTPPLHLMYIAQAIKKTGHKVKIIDFHYMLSKNLKTIQSKFDFENEMIKEVVSSKDYDLLGIGSIVSAYDFTKRLINAVKLNRPNIPIIVGGNMSIALKDLWEAETNVDYLVESDGEIVIQKFLEAYPDEGKLAKIPGLYIRRNGRLVSFYKPDLPKNLDYIDFPEWEILDNLEDYMDIQRKWINRTLPFELQLSDHDRVLPIVMSRGCPYKCTFCYHANNFYRKHSVEYLIKNLSDLKQKHRITYIFAWDDIIMFDKKWLSDLCDEIAIQKMGLRFFIGGGKPGLVTRDLLKKIRNAGVVRISYGIESGSQKILNIMKKQTTVSQNYNAVKMGIQEGIFVHLNMVVGMPGESLSTLKETLQFLASLAKQGLITSKNVSFSYATGYPGTELYQYMLDHRIVTNTEEYLRIQTGVGDYKYNLSGMNLKLMKFFVNHMITMIDFFYYLHFKKYFLAAKIFLKNGIRNLIIFVPTKLKRMLKPSLSMMNRQKPKIFLI